MNGIESPQPFLAAQLSDSASPSGAARKAAMSPEEVSARVREFNLKPTVSEAQLYAAVNRISDAAVPIAKLPEDIRETIATLKPAIRSFHGAKMSLAWFPLLPLASPCADKFGYMSSWLTRAATRLQFTPANQALLDTLGDLMADPGRETSPDSVNPAGFTYVGQFVDHDITRDVSSPLDAATDAETIHNMRTPALDLDSLYGDGPALQPFLYVFPSSGPPPTAIRFELGTNRNAGPGGPAGNIGHESGMQVQTDFDVPRVHNPLNPGGSSNTAIIGDPRNDENLIVTQFHHAMLRFHNQVVDLLVAANFAGDIFTEAKRLVTHHYQWAVVYDFLTRICGSATVTNAINAVSAPINSPFRMPVEFAVAAYRFGHSMVRDNYWVSFRFQNATMAQVFKFARNPNLPVLSSWVVDFNAFFDTGVPVPMNNKARRIDSVLASELENLPSFTGIMKVLARRNLQRGLALGLPSGQGMAKHFRVQPMTSAQLTQGLPANEIAALNAGGQVLLKKTPLWYYVLREAAVLGGGDRLGPVGGRIVARTFVRMLKRDGNSFLNVNDGFTPILPSKVSGTFTFADLLIFAGVTQP
ncbi:heme peroxidase family protein [Mesorhizobium sp.]|uniref:peroxidase family protein n=1 Tax=Mesorhizobium sp. TaxID=1871066 RepID=UPI00257E591C|nr:heme peroxidase family protein [Mesorhizobium sp.]